MKTRLFTCLLAAIALSAFAQTPTSTPAPTPPAYRDLTLPEPQRLQLLQSAQAALAPTSDPFEAEFIGSQIDYLTLVMANDWTPDVQALAEGLISSKGVYLTGTFANAMTPAEKDFLFVFAAATKQRLAFTTYADKAAFMLSVIGTLTQDNSDYVYTRLNDEYYLYALTWSADDLIAAGQYDAAVAVALQPQLLNSPKFHNKAVEFVLRAKTLQHAPDTLSWAKLDYLLADFADSQSASILVSNAFRALDGNLTRANAFIGSLSNASVTSPLAAVDAPAAFKNGPLPQPMDTALNLLLRGDKVGALRSARASYDSADGNDALNTAVGTMASLLRDIDLNLIRANAYVAAQKSGQSYPINELQ